MKQLFHFNARFLFDPQSCRVWPEDDPDNTMTLFAPASQCFALLVQQPGVILSQQYLFNEVWEKNGLYANPNTLYQNIAVLRKSLRTIGLEEEVIRTIPRQGFMFVGSVKSVDAFEEKPMSEDIPNNQNNQQPEKNLSYASSINRHRATSFLSRFAAVAVSIVALIILLYPYYLRMKSPGEFTKQFYSMGIVDGCQLYSSYEGKTLSESNFRRIAEQVGLKCQEKEWAYLTFSRQNELGSVIRCNAPIDIAASECIIFMNRETYNAAP